jgi:SAM-dependent methyltransferase
MIRRMLKELLGSTDSVGVPATKLGELQANWNRFGIDNPFSYILTQAEGEEPWREDDFFRTGEEEIARVLGRSAGLGLPKTSHRALDFGCGVGRLTQALCRHFDQCDGVDIAPSMIGLAEQHNRHGARCRYHLNDSPDLRRFENASFDFVYSGRVLQHMRPRYARAYIREFLRVLAPGGLLVFQIPSELDTAYWDGRAVGTVRQSARPLPDEAFQAQLTVQDGSLEFDALAEADVHARVRNRSTVTWPGGTTPGGRYQINLGNHWLDESGRMLNRDDARSPLPADLAPGGEAELKLRVRLPREPGDYILELDMVQEMYAWFADRGSQTARVAVRKNERRPPPPSLMEMHMIDREKVLALVARSAGRVVDCVEDRGIAPGWISYVYYVTRGSDVSARRHNLC